MGPEPTFQLDDCGDVLLRTERPSVGEGLADLASVQERGFIEWRVRGAGVLVRLRPALVSPAAYERLMHWLAFHRPEGVQLAYLVQGNWGYDSLSAPDAARRVRWLVERYGGAADSNTRRRRLPANRMPRAWHGAIDFWRQFREVDPRTSAHLYETLLGGRWILYERRADNTFGTEVFGGTQSRHVRRWLANGGAATDRAAPPNQLFAQICEHPYKSAIDRFEPRTEEIDTVAF